VIRCRCEESGAYSDLAAAAQAAAWEIGEE